VKGLAREKVGKAAWRKFRFVRRERAIHAMVSVKVELADRKKERVDFSRLLLQRAVMM
jgi:hypothetical protein